MSAAVLREAARLMRERAEAMPDWNWTGSHLWITDHDPSDPTGETPMQVAVGGADEPWANHLASWHPDVALAVADCLDSLADAMTNPDAPDGAVSTDREERRLLAVARAYLGESA